MAEPYIPSIKDFNFFFKFLFAYFFLQILEIFNVQDTIITATNTEQQSVLFKFIFLSASMFIFVMTMIGLLGIPAREIVSAAVLILVVVSSLQYLFEFTVTDSQVKIIVLSGMSLYADTLREMIGRIGDQF